MSLAHGLLLIDKPAGLSSHQVVARVRRLLHTRAVGHAGTLDPMATGLLVLLIGEATKISDFVLSGDKSYELCARLGVRTDTLDMTGEVLKESPIDSVSESAWRLALAELTGRLSLAVPKFSAVKVAGRKLYEYARSKQEISTPVREMRFENIEALEFAPPWVRARLKCEKGGYVRAWVGELGERLGCGASLQGLRRTRSEPYSIEQAIALEELERLCQDSPAPELGPAFVPLAEALPQFAAVRTSGGHETTLLRNGQIASSLRGRLLKDLRHSSGRRILDEQGQALLALVLSDEFCSLKLRRVFHY